MSKQRYKEEKIIKNGVELVIEYHPETYVKYRWQLVEYVGKIPFVEYADARKKDILAYIENNY